MPLAIVIYAPSLRPYFPLAAFLLSPRSSVRLVRARSTRRASRPAARNQRVRASPKIPPFRPDRVEEAVDDSGGHAARNAPLPCCVSLEIEKVSARYCRHTCAVSNTPDVDISRSTCVAQGNESLARRQIRIAVRKSQR